MPLDPRLLDYSPSSCTLRRRAGSHLADQGLTAGSGGAGQRKTSGYPAGIQEKRLQIRPLSFDVPIPRRLIRRREGDGRAGRGLDHDRERREVDVGVPPAVSPARSRARDMGHSTQSDHKYDIERNAGPHVGVMRGLLFPVLPGA